MFGSRAEARWFRHAGCINEVELENGCTDKVRRSKTGNLDVSGDRAMLSAAF